MRALICLLGFALLSLSASGIDFPEVTLENKEGKKIEAKLTGKGDDWARIEIKGRTYTLTFDKLTDESVALVKATELPEASDFRIDVDMKKRGRTLDGRRETIREQGIDGKTYTTYFTPSIRRDTVSGTITIRNGDLKFPTKAATVRIGVLCKEDDRTKVLHWQTYPLDSLPAGDEKELLIDESHCVHSAKTSDGDARGIPASLQRVAGDNAVEGRYTGYILTVAVGEQIVATKSIPSHYEDNPIEIEKLVKRFPPAGEKKKEK